MGGFNPFRGKLTTQITIKHDTDMTRAVRKGDVLVHRIMQKGDGISRLVNNLIALFTSSAYFHVEIYVGAGWSVTAGKHGVHFSDSIVRRSNFDALRLKSGLTDEERDRIVFYAYKQVGKPYDYFATLLMPFASQKGLVRRSANEAWMCSELTAWCYRRASIDLVPNFELGAAIAPMDIACADELEYVGSWHKGEAVAGGKLNVRNRFQKREGRLSRWISERLVKPRSSKDEFYADLAENQAKMIEKSDKV